MAPKAQSDDDAQTTTIEAGDYIYSEDIEDWDELFSADGDTFGNIRNALYQTPDGTYVHLFNRPGEKVQLRDGTITKAYSVEQVGNSVSTSVTGADIEDECVEFLIGDWDVFDSMWRGNRISVSVYRDEWPDEVLNAADEHDVTFEIIIE